MIIARGERRVDRYAMLEKNGEDRPDFGTLRIERCHAFDHGCLSRDRPACALGRPGHDIIGCQKRMFEGVDTGLGTGLGRSAF